VSGEFARRPPNALTHDTDQPAETPPIPSASSALRGHVDYADLAQRVSQGVTIDTPSRSGRRTAIRLDAGRTLIVSVIGV
jgi:hypothetical protein